MCEIIVSHALHILALVHDKTGTPWKRLQPRLGAQHHGLGDRVGPGSHERAKWEAGGGLR